MSERTEPTPEAAATTEREVVPIVEERAVVRRRERPTAGVRIRTVVREDEAVIDEPIVRETVEVERVALDRWVDGPVPVRQEGDTTIVTLLEEVVVVERRLRATEEIRITPRRTVERSPQTVALRREEAVIERVSAAGDDPREAG